MAAVIAFHVGVSLDRPATEDFAAWTLHDLRQRPIVRVTQTLKMTDFRWTNMLAAVVLPLLLAWGGWSCADDDAGKTYMGREIAPVMGWQGAAWLERPEREREERSDLLIADCLLYTSDAADDLLC